MGGGDEYQKIITELVKKINYIELQLKNTKRQQQQPHPTGGEQRRQPKETTSQSKDFFVKTVLNDNDLAHMKFLNPDPPTKSESAAPPQEEEIEYEEVEVTDDEEGDE